MNTKELVYRRNRHMSSVMWVIPFLLSEKIWVLILGLFIAFILTIASLNKKHPEVIMYLILTLSNLYSFIQLYQKPEFSNWVFLFAFFSMSVLYLKITPIFLNFTYACFISTYFWLSPHKINFHIQGNLEELQNILTTFGMIGYLFILQVRLNQKLKNDSDYERKEAKKERKKAKNTLQNMQETATIVGDFSKNIHEKVSETKETSEKATVLFQEMNERFNQQIYGIENIHTSIQGVDTNIQSVYSSSKEMTNLISRTNEIATIGQNQLTNIQKETEEVENSFSGLLKTLESLESEGTTMLEVVGFIIGLSKKTNLLSLNSRIEAMRLGKEGEGFAVIADEVHKLAEETKTSAKKIGEIIHRFKAISEISANESRKSYQNLNKHKIIIKEAKNTFQEVMENSHEVEFHSKEIDKLLEKLHQSSDEIVHQMNKISSYNITNFNELNHLAELVKEQQMQINFVHKEFSILEEKVILLNRISEEGEK